MVLSSSFATDSLMRAIIGVLEGKKVKDLVFLAKYADFANVFDKCQADVLPEDSQYDLVIKIENNQVPSFGPTYDHSRTKLKVFCEYINNMLIKRFIVLLKSPSKALVLFTKKKNGGLCLCIDFYGLNFIIKKEASASIDLNTAGPLC